MARRKRNRRSRKRRGLPPGPPAAWSRSEVAPFPSGFIDRTFFWVVFPAMSLVAVWFGVQSIGPAYQARFGHGNAGVFTAQHESCSRSCFWTGTFRADAGYVREGVGMASGGGSLSTGEQIAAKDTGDDQNVFPKSGGYDWLLTTVILGAGAAYMLYGVRWLVRRPRR